MFSIPALVRIIVVFTLAFASSAHAEPVKKLSHRDRLYDAAIYGSELFVVGHPGLLLVSSDAGATFSRRAVTTREALFSIAFNPKGQGAIVGRSGVVLVSGDQGKSWTLTTAKVPESEELPHLFGVDVLDSGAIVAVGEFGAIMRSEDQGKTWARVPYSAARPKTAEELAENEGRHRISMEEENEGAIEEAGLASVQFADDQRGFIVGEFGLALISEDGGKSWNRQKTDVETMLFDVSVVSRDNIAAVGSEGVVIETRDGGTTWERRQSGTSEHLYGVSATADRLVVSGARGIILRGARDARPLETVPTDVHTWLVSVAFSDAKTGIIVGGRGYVLRTTDDGKHYKNVFGE